MNYLPETITDNDKFYTLNQLQKAMMTGQILESRALQLNLEKQLIFDLGSCTGVMPFEECCMGIREKQQRDIAVVTRVGKRCKFVVTDIKVMPDGKTVCYLSRTIAQTQCKNEYIDKLNMGEIIPCTVTYVESFGAFCDVGCGIIALLPIDSISVSRIMHPQDRLQVNDEIYCVVKARDEQDRLVLSMRELLGTWQQNADAFKVGETVLGVVRSIESYGVFIELAPNLAGLAENTKDICVGDTVSVYIKNILPAKMKIKLVILNSTQMQYKIPLEYTKTQGTISEWYYSPKGCTKLIETIF